MRGYSYKQLLVTSYFTTTEVWSLESGTAYEKNSSTTLTNYRERGFKIRLSLRNQNTRNHKLQEMKIVT